VGAFEPFGLPSRFTRGSPGLNQPVFLLGGDSGTDTAGTLETCSSIAFILPGEVVTKLARLQSEQGPLCVMVVTRGG
jgi:hypothetical protein